MTSLRELTSGEADACRQKAMKHIQRLKDSFTPETTDEEKFKAFQTMFANAAYGVGRCRENFEGENYHRWDNDKDTATALRKTNAEGIIIMGLIQEEMGKLVSSTDHQPLAQVNGTSVQFAECVGICTKAQNEFAETDRVYREKIMGEPCVDSSRPIILQALEAKMASLVAALLFIPDTLLA